MPPFNHIGYKSGHFHHAAQELSICDDVWRKIRVVMTRLRTEPIKRGRHLKLLPCRQINQRQVDRASSVVHRSKLRIRDIGSSHYFPHEILHAARPVPVPDLEPESHRPQTILNTLQGIGSAQRK